ncbi:uncharacterized protein DSM5745_08431 [Aspergillus mulundensis]|uniref:Uncharacterized protein n=1 Tax=Aspergillus mulundensis TaxID=1810919 RepID=A0A3D8RAC2_9EURO|nr:Uncharacterized protein DSM5745_08431 [Aspergillus mulundensis]RDW70920.1 Uncharacterized protein DSM5745_08431 [Aspergillus mulundensis]
MAIVEDAGRGFLGNLTPSVFQHYPYRDREGFENDFNHAFHADANFTEWFLVGNVNEKVFASAFLEATEEPFSRWCAYDRTLKLLLVRTMKSKAHEAATSVFDNIFWEEVIKIGMQRSLENIGAATHFANIGAEEPDRAWQPTRLPRDREDKWPTLVLEVAFSEAQSKLQSDVRYWLRAAEGDVKTIITLQIARNEPRITIERWEITVNNHGNQRQQVVIRRTANNRIIVRGAPLVVQFQRLFLRPPSVPRERDVEIDVDNLEYLATRIWAKQQF